MMHYSVLPVYSRQQPIQRPKMVPWMGVIDLILEEDNNRNRKHSSTLGGSTLPRWPSTPACSRQVFSRPQGNSIVVDRWLMDDFGILIWPSSAF